MDTRSSSEDRLIGLELLRFLAALGVLVWHYQHFVFVGHEAIEWDWTRLPFRWLFAPFYTYGYDGVELFWCISGFIFTWKYGAVIGRAGLSFERFALLRFSRLYPLHLATLVAVAVLQPLYAARHGEAFVYRFNDTAHFVMGLFLANWWGFQSGEAFNGPSWSVSAEVLIYIVFFWVTRRAGAGWRTDLWTLAGFSVAAWLVKMIFGADLAFSRAGTFFYFGALTCHLYGRVEVRWRRWTALGCAGGIALFSVLLADGVVNDSAAIIAIFPASVLLVQLAVRPRGNRTRACLTGLGNLTYASYMLHFPMQLAIVLLLETVPVYSDWFMLAYLGGVLGTAAVVFRWVERPVQAWLRGLGRSVTGSRGLSRPAPETIARSGAVRFMPSSAAPASLSPAGTTD
jgi:peptidoglycan/LPS O-acetylase OafA/YrhL